MYHSFILNRTLRAYPQVQVGDGGSDSLEVIFEASQHPVGIKERNICKPRSFPHDFVCFVLYNLADATSCHVIETLFVSVIPHPSNGLIHLISHNRIEISEIGFKCLLVIPWLTAESSEL